jgi:hypothetical protein
MTAGLPPRADPAYIINPSNPYVPYTPNPTPLPAGLPPGPPNVHGDNGLWSPVPPLPQKPK